MRNILIGNTVDMSEYVIARTLRMDLKKENIQICPIQNFRNLLDQEKPDRLHDLFYGMNENRDHSLSNITRMFANVLIAFARNIYFKKCVIKCSRNI